MSWQDNDIDSTDLKDAIFQVQQKRKLTIDGKYGVQLIRSLNNTDAESCPVAPATLVPAVVLKLRFADDKAPEGLEYSQAT